MIYRSTVKGNGSVRRKIWIHRSRAIAWAIVGVLSFPLGWANSVVLVWIASLYANVSTDWGNGEAADDRDLRDEFKEIKIRLDRIEQLLTESR
jgi:hypothetical protein